MTVCAVSCSQSVFACFSDKMEVSIAVALLSYFAPALGEFFCLVSFVCSAAFIKLDGVTSCTWRNEK